MYSPIRRNASKQWNTSAFDRKLSNVRIKEEGCKEEDRQEEADVKKTPFG